jgi:hypothetical protein
MEFDQKRIESLKIAFEAAEAQIKKAENEFDELPLPPINELRYSYGHFLKALVSGDDEEYRSAEKHAKRSTYDAVDVQIIFYLELFKAFKEEYRNISIVDVIPNWIDMLGLVRQMQNQLAESTHNISREERLPEYILILEKLKSICDRCEDSRSELVKQFEKKLSDQRRFLIATILALCALAVSLYLA